MSPKEEAIKYFRERAGFSRLFLEFAKRIESLGYVGGHVVLTKLTQEEQVLLRNWFQKDYSSQKSAKISLKKFEEKFEGTRFEGTSLFEVVEEVLVRKLVYKKEEKDENERLKSKFFEVLEKTYMSETSTLLTTAILEKHPLHVGFSTTYNRGTLNELEKVYKAVSVLPLEKPIRLPLFAEKVTGNPHEFDNDGKFISALQMIREKLHGVAIQNNPNAEFINQLLFDFGILKDDITNDVTIFGLIGERNGNVLRSWEESFREKSVRNEPLREIAKLDRVYPIKKDGPVFVVENSGVFSSIIDELEDCSISIICTHGQFKLAAIQIIKLLAKEDCTIYYSGDFDPEGLLMAYALKQRHPTNIRYWNYSVEDYVKTLSNVEISSNRLQKLNNIKDVELENLLQQMKEIKKVAYQEKQIKDLVNDIKNFTK
ncbi:TIGR02679 domain-containing protein [Lysinibacillus xylanilyticus]|uniref:TIGR02679 domain-containing protein n=1 Tax=Lysinibacillus xylanilyticus TaxID=582475 RepID=UPI0037F87EEE